MALSHHSELCLTLKHTELLFPFHSISFPVPSSPMRSSLGWILVPAVFTCWGICTEGQTVGTSAMKMFCVTALQIWDQEGIYKGILPGNWEAKLVPGFCLWLGEGGHCVYIVLFLYAYKHVPLSKFPYWWGHQFDWIRTHPNDVILTSLPLARPCL